MADRITGRAFATRSDVLGREGMVASSQPLATQAGLDILKSGGNALDAALCVNACLGLMEPTGCGLGGDLFAIIWDAQTQQLYGLNGSGRSAIAATLDDMQAAIGKDSSAIPTLGPLSVSVPGCVDAWFTLHERFGGLPMGDILAPAIRYARNGFPLTEVIAHYWKHSVEKRADMPGFLATFTLDGQQVPKMGEIWKNPALADTLSALAVDGRDTFYTGERARHMADFLESAGSFLRYEDFVRHTSNWVEPVSINYRGYDIWELPPNGQGIAALQMLNILEGLDLQKMGFGSPDHLHYLVEAKKLAFADRARFYADPGFHEIPLKQLLSKEYAACQRDKIDPGRAADSIDPDPDILRHGDTVYLCTADRSGNMVSLIQSNFWGMGSGLCPPGLGLGFQNRGCAFSMDPGHANAYAPGKRPFHTIIPAFITRDKEPLCAFGVMGGDTQPQAHAQIVCNLVDFGMGLQEAGDAPRVVHSGDSCPTGKTMTDGGELAVESGFGEDTLQVLQERGHQFSGLADVFGGYQAIWRDPQTEVYSGASESRKDGQAAGY